MDIPELSEAVALFPLLSAILITQAVTLWGAVWFVKQMKDESKR